MVWRNRRGCRRALALMAVGAGLASAAMATPAQAGTSVCQFDVHLSVSHTRMHSMGSAAGGCTGLVGRAAIQGQGWFAVWGRFNRPLRSSCEFGRGTMSFSGLVGRLLSFRRDVRVSGRVGFVPAGNTLFLSGSGFIGLDPVRYSGVAQWFPDGLQGCQGARVRTGRLLERLVLTDA